MQNFEIKGEYITIAQLLKIFDYIVSGGETRYFLLDNEVLLNETKITEKKKKIYPGDVVSINKELIKFI